MAGETFKAELIRIAEMADGLIEAANSLIELQRDTAANAAQRDDRDRAQRLIDSLEQKKVGWIRQAEECRARAARF